MKGKDTAVIVVAAGRGSRFGSELPKQFCLLDGRPVLFHSIERFRDALPGAEIITVLSADRIDYWNDICREYDFEATDICTGGSTRWESVSNALATIGSGIDKVLIHDAARPLVSADVVYRLLAEIESGAAGAIPVLPMVDSLRRLSPDGSETVDRSLYRAVQTPQAFPLDKLLKAYTLPYSPEMTDDASVMEAAGFSDIRLIDGDEATLKITRPVDLAIAGLYLDRQQQ